MSMNVSLPPSWKRVYASVLILACMVLQVR